VRGTGLRPVLRVSSTLGAPCVIRYDTIALSDRCDRELSDDELGAVLAHEVAHVGRSDVIWLAGLRLLTACLWLQPLNRVALRGFLDASALVCDDWALARTRQPLELARSIARVAEWALAPRAAMEGVVGMAGADGRTLSGRIRRILSGRKIQEPASRIRRAFAASVLVLPLLLLLLLVPTVPSPVARATAIFIQRVAVVDGTTGTEAQEAFVVQMHWVGVNSQP
jgi:beta-lactamase regulating signal transducer with metallopeptidase domain